MTREKSFRERVRKAEHDYIDGCDGGLFSSYEEAHKYIKECKESRK